MRILKLLFIIFILIIPAKANTIYNLTQIPDLEIYELNTHNNLIYLYALKPFRLGVEKNISCFNSEKEILEKKFRVIKKNLDRYSKEFLKKIGLKYLVMCEDLSISGINTAGIPNNIMKTLIIDIKFNEKYFERVIHHELFHLINDSNKLLFNQDEWRSYNIKNFKYADCSTCTDKLGLDTYSNTQGFLTEYSKSTPSEDMAEVFSHLMIGKFEFKEDIILNKKIKFIKRNIEKIDNNFQF